MLKSQITDITDLGYGQGMERCENFPGDSNVERSTK